MQIIRDLEPSGRGLYAGSVGYLDFAGNLDFCIAIRTVIMSGGKAYVQAGAGIVMDSNPTASARKHATRRGRYSVHSNWRNRDSNELLIAKC